MAKQNSLPPAPGASKQEKIFLLAAALFLLLLSVILCLQISANVTLSRSFASLREFMEAQNGVIRDQIISSASLLENLTLEQSEKIIAEAAVTNSRLNRIERVYAALLDEQKKKTLKDLYDEPFVIDRYENAQKLFNEKKYRQAYDEFSFVSNEQPENPDALFFKYYSLFLVNRGDQSQYRAIKNSFLQLQKRGYSRAEIQEVLDFISNEEITPAKKDVQ